MFSHSKSKYPSTGCYSPIDDATAAVVLAASQPLSCSVDYDFTEIMGWDYLPADDFGDFIAIDALAMDGALFSIYREGGKYDWYLVPINAQQYADIVEWAKKTP
jgi:hypothetical protein